MSIWSPIGIALRDITRATAGAARRSIARAVSARSARWQAAALREPRLAEDLIVLGRLLAMAAQDDDGRFNQTPEQLAHEAGRRDMALEVLALMRLTPWQLHQMTESDDADQ